MAFSGRAAVGLQKPHESYSTYCFLSIGLEMSAKLIRHWLSSGSPANYGLTPEKVVCSCREHSDMIDAEMENVLSSRQCRGVLSNSYGISVSNMIGKEKTTALFRTLERIPDEEKRDKCAVAVYKIITHHIYDRSVIDKMSRDDIDTLVSIVDVLVNHSGLDAADAEQRQRIFEGRFANSSASFTEKLVAHILPSAGDGVSGMLKGTVGFIKSRMGMQDSSGKPTDEICLELLASPVSAFFMVAVTCFTGSTGLAIVTLPVFACWKAIGAARDVISDAERDAVDKILRTAAPRLFTAENCDFQTQQDRKVVGSNITDTKHVGFSDVKGAHHSR